MTYLDEALAAMRLPIRVRAVPYRRFRLGDFPRLVKKDCRFEIDEGGDIDLRWMPANWKNATKVYASIRRRLLAAQRGEER